MAKSAADSSQVPPEEQRNAWTAFASIVRVKLGEVEEVSQKLTGAGVSLSLANSFVNSLVVQALACDPKLAPLMGSFCSYTQNPGQPAQIVDSPEGKVLTLDVQAKTSMNAEGLAKLKDPQMIKDSFPQEAMAADPEIQAMQSLRSVLRVDDHSVRQPMESAGVPAYVIDAFAGSMMMDALKSEAVLRPAYSDLRRGEGESHPEQSGITYADR